MLAVATLACVSWRDTDELSEMPEVLTEVPGWVTKTSDLVSYTNAVPSLFGDDARVRRMNEVLSFSPPPQMNEKCHSGHQGNTQGNTPQD